MRVIGALRYLSAVLILISGFGHLVALLPFGTTTDLPVIAAGFGVLYIITGIGLFVGKWQFTVLGVIFPLIGGIVGLYVYMATPSTTALVGLTVNLIVILCCSYLLVHRRTSASASGNYA